MDGVGSVPFLGFFVLREGKGQSRGGRDYMGTGTAKLHAWRPPQNRSSTPRKGGSSCPIGSSQSRLEDNSVRCPRCEQPLNRKQHGDRSQTQQQHVFYSYLRLRVPTKSFGLVLLKLWIFDSDAA